MEQPGRQSRQNARADAVVESAGTKGRKNAGVE